MFWCILPLLAPAAVRQQPTLTTTAPSPLSCEHLQELLRTAPDARLGLAMCALDRSTQLQMAQLSVFPFSFAEDDAAAVLGTSIDRAATLLSELYGHGLVLFNRVANGYVMHPLIRQQAAALPVADSTVIEQSQAAFVRRMTEQVARWAELYRSPSFGLALSLARQNAVNLEEAWRLLLDVPAVLQQCWEQMASRVAPNVGNEHVLWMAGVPRPSLLLWERLQAYAKDVQGAAGRVAAAACASGAAESLCLDGHDAEGVGLFRQALDIRKKELGSKHPDTIRSINNLAGCLDDLDQYAAAEPICHRALRLCREVLGRNHPDTITSINNLAVCLQGQDVYDEAELKYCEALKLSHKVLGPEHPDTITSINNLAICLDSQGRYHEAEPRFRQARRLRRKVLGPEHPDTITSIYNLASCLNDQGRYAAAAPLYREALGLRRKVLGPEHLGTVEAQEALVRCMQAKVHQVSVSRRRLLLFLLFLLLLVVLSVFLAPQSRSRVSALPA